jgi:hypothetical protein
VLIPVVQPVPSIFHPPSWRGYSIPPLGVLNDDLDSGTREIELCIARQRGIGYDEYDLEP